MFILNSNLTAYYAGLVIKSNNIDINSIGITKIGKICILNGFVRFNSAVNTNTEIFRVPDICIPKSNYQFMLSKVDGSEFQYCSLGTDGIVKTWSNNAHLDASYWFLMSPVVYIANS